ncbi:proline-rich protein 11 [Danio aesculapii]|uniref:proline-rich protein 11 n=1 Tax=Danio aesculapii TaxID=1142201 RepID=UPI0024BF89F0|nr:proline-rich protein 11 [Danio aesculapii]
MGGYRGLGCAFQRRRKRNGSSRRLAIKSKMAPTAPDPDSKTKVVNMDETSIQTTKQSSPLSITALLSAFRSVVQKCRRTIYQTCREFFNVFLFWRGYAERMESLHQKVDELQRELALLHSTLKLSREVKTSDGQCEMPDGVRSLVSPPPPPPPPPPPLPPPQILVTLPPKVASIPKKTAQANSLKEKQNGPVAVTLRDLQAVRLRKVTVGQKTLMSPEKRRSPLVTLADLQKVRLRRSNSDLPLKLRSSLRTPTKNSMNLRVPLRKVNITRSPGGTPRSNKENNVTDSSLDPSMTKGLGNKYLNSLTKGLSPFKCA